MYLYMTAKLSKLAKGDSCGFALVNDSSGANTKESIISGIAPDNIVIIVPYVYALTEEFGLCRRTSGHSWLKWTSHAIYNANHLKQTGTQLDSRFKPSESLDNGVGTYTLHVRASLRQFIVCCKRIAKLA